MPPPTTENLEQDEEKADEEDYNGNDDGIDDDGHLYRDFICPFTCNWHPRCRYLRGHLAIFLTVNFWLLGSLYPAFVFLGLDERKAMFNAFLWGACWARSGAGRIVVMSENKMVVMRALTALMLVGFLGVGCQNFMDLIELLHRLWINARALDGMIDE